MAHASENGTGARGAGAPPAGAWKMQQAAAMLAKACLALAIACTIGALIGQTIARGQSMSAARPASVENPWADSLRSSR